MSAYFELEENHRVYGLMLRAELVLIVVAKGRLRVLMVERDMAPYTGSRVLPGANLCEQTCLHSSLDIMRMKLGLPRFHFDLIGMYSSPERDPRTRVASAAYLTLTSRSRIDAWLTSSPRFCLPVILEGPDDGFSYRYDDEMIVPGFDHGAMISDGIRHLRKMVDNSSIAFDALEFSFTLLELQSVHEAILGEPIEKVRFRKRMLARIFPANCDHCRGRTTEICSLADPCTFARTYSRLGPKGRCWFGCIRICLNDMSAN